MLAIGLAKDPKKRFQTATELATWFAAAAENKLTTAQRDRADELIALAAWDAMVVVATIGR